MCNLSYCPERKVIAFVLWQFKIFSFHNYVQIKVVFFKLRKCKGKQNYFVIYYSEIGIHILLDFSSCFIYIFAHATNIFEPKFKFNQLDSLLTCLNEFRVIPG